MKSTLLNRVLDVKTYFRLFFRLDYQESGMTRKVFVVSVAISEGECSHISPPHWLVILRIRLVAPTAPSPAVFPSAGQGLEETCRK
jgi:hypothetical protein